MAIPMEAERSIDFGARLKRRREERGIALREIADTTKISVGALEALERNDLSRLPGGIFSRGFIRAYAEQIGMDPDDTVREFIKRFPNDSVADGIPDGSSSHAIAGDARPAGRRWVVVAVIVLTAFAIGAAVLLIVR